MLQRAGKNSLRQKQNNALALAKCHLINLSRPAPVVTLTAQIYLRYYLGYNFFTHISHIHFVSLNLGLAKLAKMVEYHPPQIIVYVW